MSRNISYRRPRGDYAKPLIEGGELAQKRLQGSLTQASLLWTGRILEWLQAVQDKQGSTMRDELRESFALFPRGSELRIWISKPTESRVKKFMC